jgi:methionyl-tRNA formyltransferase
VRVLFLGSGAFGLPTLEHLRGAHDLVGIVTQPDRPAGRKQRLTPTPVGTWAQEHAPDLPLIRPDDVNVPEVAERVRSVDAEAWVIIAFGQKLGAALLEDRFAINLHASLLPRWRGAAPINRAVMAGDAETGNSVITIADRMDAGLVLGQSRRAIPPDQTAGELHDLLSTDGPPLIEQVLQDHARGTLDAVEQDETKVTRARKLSRADAWVDFTASADACRCRIHGLTPWPGVSVGLGEINLKLLRVATIPGGGAAGTLVDSEQGLVQCGTDRLRLLEVQPAGKRAMSWSDFARGNDIAPGTMLRGGAPC